MEEDLFQLRQLPVVKFRRTGESARSEDDTASGEHEVQIEGVRAGLEAVELDDGAAVPKEFANPTDDTFMVEDAVEAIGFGKFQWKLSVLTGLAWMADAMEMMILSILAPQLHCEWRLPSWQVALLTSVVFVGMMSSSTLWGNISDQYGRKTGLKISVLWTLYYGILSAFAPVYSWILVLRGLVGFGIGGVPQSVTLYAEFLPMKARAKCILLIEVFWAIGTVFEVVLAVFVMPSLGWRWLLILSAVPLLLFAVLCFWLPESARYDVLSGNQEKAIATLKRIATENGAPMPLGKLIISRQEDRGKMRDLFTPHFRWTTLLLWFIWFSNAFSYYGLVLLTTELFQAGDVCSISSRKKAVEAKCSLACEYLSEEDYMDLLWTTLSEFPEICSLCYSSLQEHLFLEASKQPTFTHLRSAQLSGAFTLSHHPKSCYLHPTFQAQLQPCLLQEALQDIPPPLTSFYPHCLCPALVFLVLPHGLSPKETLTKAPCGQGLGLLRFDSCLA
ncbi:synaptic vesicle 2-related protein isoform X2 [Bubalus bubalis]|uniref:synaptic vesicle 2-related protein isoform X2 n=1 Tax=Bubalus bubalis TaxID=89462 RepID=UPI001D125C56|nr:synaptic vesicle 2-related protein isoform X2 [Bubalus bubalis]